MYCQPFRYFLGLGTMSNHIPLVIVSKKQDSVLLKLMMPTNWISKQKILKLPWKILNLQSKKIWKLLCLNPRHKMLARKISSEFEKFSNIRFAEEGQKSKKCTIFVIFDALRQP